MKTLCSSLTSDTIVNLQDYDWERKKPLGTGTYGKCYLVTSYSKGIQLCAKIARCSPEHPYEQELLLREVMGLKSLRHPAIVKFYGMNFYDFRRKPNPTIFLEYLTHGTLASLIKNCNENKAPPEWNNTKKQICFIGLTSALKQVHSLNMMHRDIKPENILLDENYYPRLCDFGLAKTLKNNTNLTPTGAPFYMAPEILNDQPYNQSADVYSYSLTVFELLTNKSPYENFLMIHKGRPNKYQLTRYVSAGNRPSFDDTNIPQPVRDLLTRCWSSNPIKRPTFDEIYNEIVNDDLMRISDDVNTDEVRQYIDLLQRETIQPTSRQLALSSVISLEMGQYEDFPDDPYVMYSNILQNGFQTYPLDDEIKLFRRICPEIAQADTPEKISNFIKVVIFINSIASTNLQGRELQTSLFGSVPQCLEGLTQISSSSIGRQESYMSRLNLPSTVTDIQEHAFENNQYLININIPDNVISIGQAAFRNCRKLKWINLYNRMTIIEADTFADCENLLHVEFPPQLQKICSNAFLKCKNLTEITLPPTHQIIIENNAFTKCKKLRTVYVSGNTQLVTSGSPFPFMATIKSY